MTETQIEATLPAYWPVDARNEVSEILLGAQSNPASEMVARAIVLGWHLCALYEGRTNLVVKSNDPFA